jgi:hypothetical protein
MIETNDKYQLRSLVLVSNLIIYEYYILYYQLNCTPLLIKIIDDIIIIKYYRFTKI